MHTANRLSWLISLLGKMRLRQMRIFLLLSAMITAVSLLSYPLIEARLNQTSYSAIEMAWLGPNAATPAAAATITVNDAGVAVAKVIGNYIGLDISSTFALGNGVSGSGMAAGVLIENAPNNQIGGTDDGEFNFIRNNNQSGVVVLGNTAVGNRILSNSISGNAGLGIDLGNDGVTMNDGGEGDIGPNNKQNSPVLSSVLVGSSSTQIIGTLNSLPDRSFRLEFFYNGACDSGGAGEWLAKFGSTDVTTNGASVADFTRSFDTLIAEGQFIGIFVLSGCAWGTG